MSPTVRKRTDRRLDRLARLRRRERRHRHQQAAPPHDLAPVREVERSATAAARARCTARRRARSSWRSETRAGARPGARGRCRGPTARDAGSSGPTGRSCRGSRRSRSLARAFSSSRRAPPISASRPSSSIASSSVTDCAALRESISPRSRTVPRRSSRRPSARSGARRASAARSSRNSITSGKLWPVSMCSSGKRQARRPERLLRQAQHHAAVLAAGEQQRRLAALGRDFAQDVDRFGLEPVQVIEATARQWRARRDRGTTSMRAQRTSVSLCATVDVCRHDVQAAFLVSRRRPPTTSGRRAGLARA